MRWASFLGKKKKKKKKKKVGFIFVVFFPPEFPQEISSWTLHSSFATRTVCRAQGKTVILLQSL
jgi:hypothetical protein